MLVGLKLENIVLLDSEEIDFYSGLTALTGQTGSGKSILLEAIDVVLGGANSNSGSRLLRSDKKFSRIEAIFEVNPPVLQWLDSQSIDIENNQLYICREWRLRDGRLLSRTRLNGVLTNRQQINNLRPLLVDFTFQGQFNECYDSNKQLYWLDRLGGHIILEIHKEVQSAWKEWHENKEKLDNFKNTIKELNEKREESKFLLEELERAQLDDPHEIDHLKNQEDKLVNGVNLQNKISTSLALLSEANNDLPSALDQIGLAIKELEDIKRIDQSLSNQLDQALDVFSLLQKLISELETYYSSLDSDPSSLEDLQDRLDQLKRMERTHRMQLPELLERRDYLRANFNEDSDLNSLSFLQDQELITRKRRDEMNIKLSSKRRAIADNFQSKLLEYLQKLGLSNICFEVKITSKDPTHLGADNVAFLFSDNPGQPLLPLSQVASGGEKSRFWLAMKTVLAQVDGPETLIFDEIDSGISGKVSGCVAKLLKELSGKRQVFCVTHQPLVAASADHHMSIRKNVDSGATFSKALYLKDFEERKIELAELAGGSLREASAYAESLLEQQAA